MKSRQHQEHTDSQMARVVDRNIRALLERRKREEEKRPLQLRLADAITAFTGSMAFVYLHLVVFGAWIFVNLPMAPAWMRFDPTYVVLAMVASVESIFLSTFILITQNRMQTMANKRDDLELQISLLSEHEVTRLITLVRAIAEKMGIQESHDHELSELAKDVEPERVLDKISETEQEVEHSRKS